MAERLPSAAGVGVIRGDELDGLQLDPASRVILQVLDGYADRDTGVCCPGLDAIASRARVSVSTVRRRLSVLERTGAIALERSRGGRWCTHAYRLLVGSWRALELAPFMLADAFRAMRDRLKRNINARFARMRFGRDRLDGDQIRAALELKLASDRWLTSTSWQLVDNLARCRARTHELAALTGRVLRLALDVGAMSYEVQNAISYAGYELRLATVPVGDPVAFAYHRIARQLRQLTSADGGRPSVSERFGKDGR